jgi:hypothetical protein
MKMRKYGKAAERLRPKIWLRTMMLEKHAMMRGGIDSDESRDRQAQAF